MSSTPKVGDRVRATRTSVIEGEVLDVYPAGMYGRYEYGDLVRIQDKDGLVYKVAGAKHTFEKIEPPLQGGDVLLYMGLTRVRTNDGKWVDQSGQNLGGSDEFYLTGAGRFDARFLVKAGRVVA